MESTNVDLGDAFRHRATQAIAAVGRRYFGQLEDANVHVRHEGRSFACSVRLHVSSLPMKSGEATHRDCTLAFQAALNKAATQLRRLKRAIREDKPGRNRR